MALKLKDEPVTTVQKTGSDYINRDYSRLADEILQGEDELPESRYSSSNTYQAMNNDMKELDAQFKLDEYKYQYQDNTFSGFNKFDTGRTLPRLKWFTGGGSYDDPVTIYIGIVICAIFVLMFFHRGMTSLRDVNLDTVEVEATVISVEKQEKYEKRGKHGRWVDYYKTTYEWVGENGEIQSNTRYYDERKFSEGNTATVTVLASNLNQEIDSKTTAKGKVVSSFCFCIGSIALLVVCVVRLKKSQE